MYNIYLLENFNNYYNRRIIRYETIKEYWTHQTNNKRAYINFKANFIPNDGVSTEHIVNAQQLDIKWNPDYLILVDEYEEIVQRWFVIDSVRTTMGQYRLSLKRDTVADYFNEAISAPCFIEKAKLKTGNPLLYNKENLSVNQIKQSEYLLKDSTETPWIVGYLDNNFDVDAASAVFGPGSLTGKDFWIGKFEMNSPLLVSIPTEEEAHRINSITETLNGLYGLDADEIIRCSQVNGRKNQKYFVCPSEFSDSSNSATYIENSRRYFSISFEINKLGINNSSAVMCFTASAPTNVGSPSEATLKKVLVDPGLYEKDNGKENWEISKDNVVPFFNEFCKTNINQGLLAYTSTFFNPMVQEGLTKKNINFVNTKIPNDAPNITIGDTKKYYSASNNTLYEVTLRRKVQTLQITIDENWSIFNVIKNWFKTGPFEEYFDKFDKYPPKNGAFKLLTYIPMFYFDIIETPLSKTVSYGIPKNPKKLKDAPYKMFTLPFNTLGIQTGALENITEFDTDPNITFQTALDISRKLTGSNHLFDLQIVPYCPVPNIVKGKIFNNTDSSFIEGTDFTYIYAQDIDTSAETTTLPDPSGIIFFADTSNITFNIEVTSKLSSISTSAFENKSAEDIKIANQCDFIRICSPNYASAFDITPAKNNGIDYFTVNITYRPYDPFIQVYPNFKELYGNDFNDNRGLILAGDFSLPQLNDAWITYQLNNKTYQASFDRTIQNMEFNYYSGLQDALPYMVGGVAKGFANGASNGGPIGALVGGAASAAGAVFDIAVSQYRFNETRDLAKDQFGFRLENIQALAQTLTKTSALTINHKLFPFIEFYSCTDTEKFALLNKIKYNGMTVGVISEIGIEPYMFDDETFIKGSIIDINIPDDAHIAQDISKEVFQGLRIKHTQSLKSEETT